MDAMNQIRKRLDVCNAVACIVNSSDPASQIDVPCSNDLSCVYNTFGTCDKIQVVSDLCSIIGGLVVIPEAKVLTKEQLNDCKKGTDLWIEEAYDIDDDTQVTAITLEDIGNNWCRGKTWDRSLTFYNCRSYGWRAWSYRPTPEQIKETEWTH